MKIQILSDLHNEFLRNGKNKSGHKWSGVIPQTDADLIVLAGDIDTGTRGIEWAISEAKRLDKRIVYVSGNHEFYGYEYGRMKQEIAGLCDATDVFFLDSGVFVEDGVRFIGTTLWTDYKADTRVPRDLVMDYVNEALADHRVIKFRSGDSTGKFTPRDALAIHVTELDWLTKQLASDFPGKTVVVTHHGPHPVCQHPAFPVSEMSAAFHSDLSSLIASFDIDTWIYGHTHSNLDEVVLNTRIISNQAGYPGENVDGFDPGLVIEV